MLTRIHLLPKQLSHPIRKSALFLLVLIPIVVSAQAQTFNSGSNGSDGPYEPSRSETKQVPESGVFNFTTVRIPANAVITFKPNSRNTPVTILASGDVRIAGSIQVNGQPGDRNYGGLGGPGGFRGGEGGVWLNDPSGKAGEGPGGGSGAQVVADNSKYNGGAGGGYLTTGAAGSTTNQNPAPGGPAYGTKVLLPLIGGSGGGGASATITYAGGGGGGGAGAILIASSTKIIFESGWSEMGIYAIGGDAGFTERFFTQPLHTGGSGSGGAVRLVANTITGTPKIWAEAGSTYSQGGTGARGYVRVEAFDLSQFRIDTRGNDNFSLGRPNPVTLPNNPQLRIASVGGVNAPAQPVGSFYTTQPDVAVPATVTSPVEVVVQATNLPGNPAVQITRITDAGERTTVNCTLAGSQASSTCTARIPLQLTKTILMVATTTVDGLLAFAKPVFVDGERVNKVEIAAGFGGGSEVTYITHSGRRIKLSQ